MRRHFGGGTLESDWLPPTVADSLVLDEWLVVPDKPPVPTQDASTNNPGPMCDPRGPVSSKHLCVHVLLALGLVESNFQPTNCLLYNLELKKSTFKKVFCTWAGVYSRLSG